MIVNEHGDAIPSLSMSIEPDAEKPFSLRIECRDGYELTAISPDADVTIWAKAEVGDAFQDIGTTPIDLEPFAPATKVIYFECRCAAGQPAGALIYQIIVERS